MMELDRNAKRYREIEEFADYELTQCIVYEMAIRNKKYQQQIDNVVEYYKKHKEQIDRHLKNQYGIAGDDILIDRYLPLNNRESFYRERREDKEKYHELHKLVDGIDCFSPDLSNFNADYYESGDFGSDFLEIIHLLQNNSKMNKYNPERGEVRLISSDNIKRYFTYNDDREGYITSTELSVHKDYTDQYIDDTIIDYKVIKIANAFSELVNDKTNKDAIEVNISIKKNFKRPTIKIDNLISRNVQVTLNLNKPLDELIAYITHIKNDIDKNTLKAPIEIFCYELEKADDISKMCTTTKNGNEICFDGRKGVTRKQKLADMFFIYDAVQSGGKELEIRMALSEYYEIIGKTTDMSEKTFRKYRNIAIDYIEKERYKELLTGVKL